MVTLDHGVPFEHLAADHAVAGNSFSYDGLLTVVFLLVAGALGGLFLTGLLRLALGPLPLIAWVVPVAVEMMLSVVVAGTLMASGSTSRRSA